MNNMEEKYMILEGDNILASNMNFKMAIVFIKGYKDTYHNKQLNLTIREELDCVKKENEYQE